MLIYYYHHIALSHSHYIIHTGMERHELEVEHIGLWGCKRPSDTASSYMEARCADVQQVRMHAKYN